MTKHYASPKRQLFYEVNGYKNVFFFQTFFYAMFITFLLFQKIVLHQQQIHKNYMLTNSSKKYIDKLKNAYDVNQMHL